MKVAEKFQNSRAEEKNRIEVFTFDPELIKAVDEVFAQGIGRLEVLQISPEMEKHLGPWTKQSGGDRTAGDWTEE